MEQDVPYKSATQLDKKRYLWLISPFLPVLGMGILGLSIRSEACEKSIRSGSPFIIACDHSNN